MKRNKIFRILLFATVPIFLLGATLFVLIISQGGSVTSSGEAGVVKINTDPANADIRLFVDNNLVEPLNNKGANISAGTHLIRVESEGMANWEKKISITKGIVNEVFAKLFPLNMSLTQVTNTNVQKIFFTSGNDFAFYVVKDSEFGAEKGIWKLPLTQGTLFFINNSVTPIKFVDLDSKFAELLNDPDYQIIPSPDASRLLLISPEFKTTLVISLQVLDQKPVIQNLTEKLSYNPEQVTWLNNSNSLLIKDSHALFEYNLSNSINTLIRYSPGTEIISGANNNQVIYYDQITKLLNIYKNQTSQLLELKNITTPQDITNIYLAQKTNRFIAVSTKNSFYFIDTEKSSIKEMPTGDAILIDKSPDGLSYIFQDKQGVLFSYTVNENLGLNALETKTTKLPFTISPKADTMVISPLSTNILYYSEKDTTIYSLDRDGSNQITLVTSPNIKPFFNFDSSATSLIVLIQDENKNQADTNFQPRTNIYKLNLLKTTP